MSRLPRIALILWKGWSYLCGTVVLLLAVLIVGHGIGQSRKAKEFIHSHLLPLASYVENFRASHNRLPTESEFKEWSEQTYENKATWYFPERPDFVSSWGSPGRDFIVGAWRGEWVEYYQSWDHKVFDGDVH